MKFSDSNGGGGAKFPVWSALALLLLLVVGGFFLVRGDSGWSFGSVEDAEDSSGVEVADSDDLELGEMPTTEGISDELKILEEENKARLSRGCFGGKDCIPAIDDPKFIGAEQASSEVGGFLFDDDWVIGLERGSIVRAYPIKILNWHEIVNDTVGDEAIAISFCPLCYTGNAFIREVEGEATTFGVSGYLVNSNLVMYDRKTESLWEQLTGEAMVGSQIGKKLEKITVSTLPWSEWHELHPETEVLSLETGHQRDYQLFPYGDYNTSRDVYFPLENRDSRLPEKELVYGVVLDDGSAKAYARAALELQHPDGGVFEDAIGEHDVRATWQNGRFSLEEAETGAEIVPEIGFWFSWVAFYPDTEIF